MVESKKILYLIGGNDNKINVILAFNIELCIDQYQWSLSKSQTIGADKFWGRQILGHLGYFWPIYEHPFWYCESLLSMFSINQLLFLQKTKPLYPNPEYLFGIGIWTEKNKGFSHRVSVVRAYSSTLHWCALFSGIKQSACVY